MKLEVLIKFQSSKYSEQEIFESKEEDYNEIVKTTSLAEVAKGGKINRGILTSHLDYFIEKQKRFGDINKENFRAGEYWVELNPYITNLTSAIYYVDEEGNVTKIYD